VAGGVFPALLTVAPGLERAARVTRASTSAGLFNGTTNERFEGSGGEHCYVLVKDGADIDRATQAFHARAWLHGLGWIMLGKVGQLLDRSLIDVSVRFPERLCFEGSPEVIPPLSQDAALRACKAVEGEAIDTRVMIPDITASERQQVEDLKAAMRRTLEPQAQAVRADVDNKLAQDIIRREGVPSATASRRVAAWRRGILSPCIELDTDHRGRILVRDILLNPLCYVGVTLCDPYEGPDYGYDKAKIMVSQHEPGHVFVHSFAHGGGTYDLKHDVHSAEAALMAAPVAGIADTLCDVVDASDIEPEEVQHLVDRVADRASLGRQALKRRLKTDQDRRARARRQSMAAARRTEGVLDQRLRRPAPPPDGEVGPVVAEIDRALADDDTARPPMRRPDGTLVELRSQVPFNLHQLAATGSNDLPTDGTGQLPAPAEPLLMEMTRVTVELMVERYFVFEKTDKDGNFLYNAALPASYVNAFMQLPVSVSKLPHVYAVNTAPMVAENGAIIEGFGLDRESGVFHHIEPGLRDCLPKGGVTEEDVRNAVRWLCDEWLIDVLTDITGKMVAISLAITLIQRLLLAMRPAYLVSAGLRGGGKTTLCHMLMMAVFGRMAAAASWSEIQEERRKSLFAHFRQGVASLVWDNIRNGAEIACPEVEKALTSPTIQDRILGVSQFAAVPTSTVQIFVGNNIKFAGDMSSRGPEIRLLTDEPNPEDRLVAHVDPIAWTRDHRAEILHCLYTIMIYGCRRRPAGQVAKTRFKSWWSLVGWPTELAASLIGVGLNFDTVFKSTEEQDSRASGIATALHLLKDTFAEKWFRARDIRTILDEGELARVKFLRTGINHEDPIRASAAFLEMVEELTGKRNRNPITNIIGKALVGITDRPVNLDAATRGILRTRLHDGNNEFSVEIRRKGPAGKSWSSTTDRPESDPLDPLVHLKSACFEAPDGSSCAFRRSRPPIPT
jgi:hypothetical protein